MRFWLRINCDSCGYANEYQLNRETNKHEDGRVYEDFTSISDSLNKKGGLFNAKVQPEGNRITCGNCGNKHDLEI